jgi:hypothetical protein
VYSAEQNQWEAAKYDREDPAARSFCNAFLDREIEAWILDDYGKKCQIDPDEWAGNPRLGEMLSRLNLLRSGSALSRPELLLLEGRIIYVDTNQFEDWRERAPVAPPQDIGAQQGAKPKRRRQPEADDAIIKSIKDVDTILRANPGLVEQWRDNKDATAKTIRDKMMSGTRMSLSWISTLLRGKNKAANRVADENPSRLRRFWPLS